MSVKEICEKLWELENKYKLLNKEIRGVKIWHLCRFSIYCEIAQKMGIFTKPHTSKNRFSDLIKAFPSYLFNSLINNPILGDYEKDFLIFDHPRKILVDGEYIDIYTKYILDDLDNDAYDAYDVIERPYLNKHLSKKEENRKYLDYLYLITYIKNTFSIIDFSSNDLKLINLIEKQIDNYFNIRLDIKNIFTTNIKKFRSYYGFYDKLLKKRKCKKVFIVVSYLNINMPLIAAAKANNIEVIEIQHGTISPYHLGYNFPNCNSRLEYFPDFFYSFGEFWKDAVDFPISRDNIISYGFIYLKKRKDKYSKLDKKERQILVISQGAIGIELSRFILKAAKVLQGYKFIYKLHPGEYERWRKEYKELILASKLDNIEVVDNNQREIYYYFAQSEYQIGVFSTAIYEGLAFNCKTLLVDLPGIEYMEYIINKGIVKIIKDVDDLIEQLKNFNIANYDEHYFFC